VATTKAAMPTPMSPKETCSDWKTVRRTLEKPDTAILDGMQIFHNYVRPHEGLGGRTPSEAAGIKVEGENKWLTLIQNASRKVAKS